MAIDTFTYPQIDIDIDIESFYSTIVTSIIFFYKNWEQTIVMETPIGHNTWAWLYKEGRLQVPNKIPVESGPDCRMEPP